MLSNYVLIEVVERSIHEPVFCRSYTEAFDEMVTRFAQALGIEGTVPEILNKYYETESPDAAIGDYVAFCENRNHDNCDWRICEVE